MKPAAWIVAMIVTVIVVYVLYHTFGSNAQVSNQVSQAQTNIAAGATGIQAANNGLGDSTKSYISNATNILAIVALA